MELGVFVVSKRRGLCSEGDSSLCPRRCKSASGRTSLPADITGEMQREEPRPESHFQLLKRRQLNPIPSEAVCWELNSFALEQLSSPCTWCLSSHSCYCTYKQEISETINIPMRQERSFGSSQDEEVEDKTLVHQMFCNSTITQPSRFENAL